MICWQTQVVASQFVDWSVFDRILWLDCQSKWGLYKFAVETLTSLGSAHSIRCPTNWLTKRWFVGDVIESAVFKNLLGTSLQMDLWPLSRGCHEEHWLMTIVFSVAILLYRDLILHTVGYLLGLLKFKQATCLLFGHFWTFVFQPFLHCCCVYVSGNMYCIWLHFIKFVFLCVFVSGLNSVCCKVGHHHVGTLSIFGRHESWSHGSGMLALRSNWRDKQVSDGCSCLSVLFMRLYSETILFGVRKWDPGLRNLHFWGGFLVELVNHIWLSNKTHGWVCCVCEIFKVKLVLHVNLYNLQTFLKISQD